MPQPIEEGTVLGGRYRVTGHVVTSAHQDMVLEGRDQVLNRDVAILVASTDHASQVATSARELATGDRRGEVQVLDLGLSDGRTYLIASGDSPTDELLGLAEPQQVYVEPFYTDTLGSELFGESRTFEPHVYEDDDDYYSELDAPVEEEQSAQRRPKFLNRISDQLNRRLGTSGGAAGAAAAGGAAAAASVPDDGPLTDEHRLTGGAPQRGQDEEIPLPDSIEDDFGLDSTQAHQTVPSRAQEVQDRHVQDQPVTGEPVREEDSWEDLSAEPTDDQVQASEDHDHRADGHSSKVSLWEDDEDEVVEDLPAVEPGEAREANDLDSAGHGSSTGLAAGGAGLAAGAAAAGGSGRSSWSDFLRGSSDRDSSEADRHDPEHDGSGRRDPADEHVNQGSPADPDHDRDAAAAPVGDPDEDDRYEEYEEQDRPGAARWLMAGILALLLVLAAVFAFNILGNNTPPEAGGNGTESPAQTDPARSSEPPTSDLPAPQIAGVSRLVPDMPTLSAETDGTLPNAVDGNPATAWQPYSFAQPAFGGYASSMALVVELEEPSAVSEVNITQNNGSGGSFAILVGETDDITQAAQIAGGSFTGPEFSVPVSQNGQPVEGQYVFINFTELPQLSNASGNLPYGLRIAEVEVN